MKFEQIQNEIRKLEKDAGKNASEAILKLMDLKASSFEEKLDSLKFRISVQTWVIGIIGLLMTLAVTIATLAR